MDPRKSETQFIPKLYGFKIFGKKGSKYYKENTTLKEIKNESKEINSTVAECKTKDVSPSKKNENKKKKSKR